VVGPGIQYFPGSGWKSGFIVFLLPVGGVCFGMKILA
jgi:hypothetical protein